MKNPQFFITNNYDLFELGLFNRDIRKIKKLQAVMRKHGFIFAHPLHVSPKNEGGKFPIKCGHHRFEVAREFKLYFSYVVSDDTASIPELEAATNRWTLQDFVRAYARMQVSSYALLEKYQQETGIPLSCCIGLMLGRPGGGTAGNDLDKVKGGEFSVKDLSLIERVTEITQKCAAFGIKCASNQLFVKAIAYCLSVEEFKPDLFIKSISAFPSLIPKKPSTDEYLECIEAAYNRNRNVKSKIPLAFLAKEAARKRSCIQRKVA